MVVVDEAHNLPLVAREAQSYRGTVVDFEPRLVGKCFLNMFFAFLDVFLVFFGCVFGILDVSFLFFAWILRGILEFC